MMLLNQRFQPWKSRHNYQHTDQAAAPSVILSDSDISDISNLQEWPIKYILRETATEYLIDWEGPYDPTWEPKENASELAIQAWNKRKARNSRALDSEATRVQSSCLSYPPTGSSSSARTKGDSQDPSFVPSEYNQGETSLDPSVSSFVHRDSTLEIPESPQFRHLELSGYLAETTSPFQTSTDCSPFPASGSTGSDWQTGSSALEYVPESSIASIFLLRGERRGGARPETLQPDRLQYHATSDTGDVGLSEALLRSSNQRQCSGDISNVRDPVQPATPVIESSCEVYEISETPDQPQFSGSRVSDCGSNLIQDLPSQISISVPSQPLVSSGLVFEGTTKYHRSSSYHAHIFIASGQAHRSYHSSIPETVLDKLSQHSESQTAEASTRPMLPLSSLMEPNPSGDMGNKEAKPLKHFTSSAQSDRYGDLPGSALKEKTRSDWAQLGSEPQPGTPQAGTAIDTPSSVGDIEATMSAPIPETTVPLSIRFDTGSFSHSHTAVHHGHSEPLLTASELAHGGNITQSSMQTIQPSALTVTGMDEITPGSVQLGLSEYAVTLPMDSRVKDDYERVITDAATNFRQFFESFQSNSQHSASDREELYSGMRGVVSRLNNIAMHPDLNISEHLKGVEPDFAKEASWAEYSSAKFLFLGHFMELAGMNELHVIIAVGDEKKQKILERYLQGKGFAYTRPREEMGSAVEVSLAKGPLSFGIHSSESARELFKTPSAIFALDSSFSSKSPSMQHIRTTYSRNGNLLPVIWFLVANTSEHIERCLPEMPATERLHLLVHYIARLHDEVGDLQDNALGVQEDAEEILGYLLDSASGWPLPTIEPLNFVSLEELEVSNDSSSDEAPPQPPKRALEEGSEIHSSKRPRVGTQEDSQLTESTKPPSQTLDRDLQSLEKNLIQMKATHSTEKDELQAELNQAKTRWHELEKTLGTLQHRYETRTNEFHKTRQERDHLTASKSTNEERVEKQRDIISKLKEERLELNSQLDESRKALKDGGGTTAEMEMLRDEIRRLKSENESLVHKADFEKRQSEYTREQYQTASTAAAQSGTENRLLVAENEALKRRVDGNMVRLHEINTQNASARHTARIEELEITLAARDEFLRKKEEELREIRKNRPSTRSTSTQPRSPKWANSRPTSPGVGHNGNGNGNGGVSGRGSGLRYSSGMQV
ncbi:unnamed protein product [Penicillium salamii]|uniref:Chromo domain-containing protein n=1 Tax=Penicillium salamii TaxID=1612424 RepID=A0A9W4NLP5_9EURO|nr:unnamed protein product [Penicillium salamii]CAG8375948.1 unnamed protein product [Penicillium salamii]CAG8384690.1 unnamed protein product [Penicillium salamii]CAG8416473.1 unnamed protein product [Penicillium salamii]